MTKKAFLFISMGFLNVIHGLTHVIQFIQSMTLLSYSTQHHHTHDGVFMSIMNSSYMSILWCIIGLMSLIIGIKDYIHHKKCKD